MDRAPLLSAQIVWLTPNVWHRHENRTQALHLHQRDGATCVAINLDPTYLMADFDTETARGAAALGAKAATDVAKRAVRAKEKFMVDGDRSLLD